MARRYYHANKEYHLGEVQKNTARYAKARLLALRGLQHRLGCQICGEDEPCCLDFHHVDEGTKNGRDATVSKLRTVVSLERLLAEIQKCAVLCANCHRKFHEGVIRRRLKRISKVELIKAEKDYYTFRDSLKKD